MTRRVAALLLGFLAVAVPARAAVEFTVKNCSGGVTSIRSYNDKDDLRWAFHTSIPQLVHKGTTRIGCDTGSCQLIVGYPPDHLSSSGRVREYLFPTYSTDLCLRSANDTVLYEMYVCTC